MANKQELKDSFYKAKMKVLLENGMIKGAKATLYQRMLENKRMRGKHK